MVMDAEAHSHREDLVRPQGSRARGPGRRSPGELHDPRPPGCATRAMGLSRSCVTLPAALGPVHPERFRARRELCVGGARGRRRQGVAVDDAELRHHQRRRGGNTQGRRLRAVSKSRTRTRSMTITSRSCPVPDVSSSMRLQGGMRSIGKGMNHVRAQDALAVGGAIPTIGTQPEKVSARR